MRFTEFFEGHFSAVELLGKRPTTREKVQGIVNSFVRFAGDVELLDIDDTLLGRYLQKRLDSKRAASTVNGDLVHLKWILRAARDCGIAVAQIRLKPLAVELDDPQCWSEEQYALLLASAAQEPGLVGEKPAWLFFLCYLLLQFATGLRVSALMAVESRDLDLERGVLRVRGRTQKDRVGQTFELIPAAVEFLRLLDPVGRQLVRVLDDWPYDRGSRQWPALTRRIRRILRRAELPYTIQDVPTPTHIVRKTFATLIASRAGEAVAQTLLGHSHLSTTRRYLDPSKLDRPSAAKLLPAVKVPAVPLKVVGL